MENGIHCPLPPNKTCKEVKELHRRIRELERQVVSMRCYDSNITESRVFEISFSKLLHPEEAMDIFLKNVKEIFEREG